MKKTLLIRLAILFLITSTLSGCIWAIEDDGYRGGGYYERGHEGHRGEGHEHH